MDNQQLLQLINSTPTLQSLLYDCNLLPEIVQEGTMNWHRMNSVALAYLAGKVVSQDKIDHLTQVNHQLACQPAYGELEHNLKLLVDTINEVWERLYQTGDDRTDMTALKNRVINIAADRDAFVFNARVAEKECQRLNAELNLITRT